jgi:hypothetical protein
MSGSNNEIWGRDLGSNIVIQYSIGPIIALHDRITAGEYVDSLCNQVKTMLQKLFPNNDALFQDDSVPIHTTGTVETWFEEKRR